MSAHAETHAHAETQETTEPDNTNVGLIATVVVIGALLVVSTAAALTAMVRTESSAYGNEVGAYANLGTVKRLKADQHAKLEASPGWSDKDKGLVSLPIDRAMGLVTAEISKNPNLATPEAPATAQPAASGEPAPAEPAPSATPPAKDGKPEPAKGGGKQPENKGTQGSVQSPVKIEAPKGAPVAPAGAPAKHE
jgi:hypothetical protein